MGEKPEEKMEIPVSKMVDKGKLVQAIFEERIKHFAPTALFYTPTTEAFTLYCSKYPLSILDYGFQRKHLHVGGNTTIVWGDRQDRDTDIESCKGCRFCVFSEDYVLNK